jgi:hypothetical protein
MVREKIKATTVREKIKATTVRLVRGMKRLGLLSRSIRCIERSFF